MEQIRLLASCQRRVKIPCIFMYIQTIDQRWWGHESLSQHRPLDDQARQALMHSKVIQDCWERLI